MEESTGRRGRWSRPVVTVVMTVGVVLGLQLPIALIRGLIHERVTTRDAAFAEVTGTWGGPQSIIGPRLEIPYRRGGHGSADPIGYASVLPESLSVEGTVRAESRRRGLFDVPIYDAEIGLRGRFDANDVASSLGVAGSDLLWDRAILIVEVSDPKAVGTGSALTWSGSDVPLLPGSGASGRAGVHGRVGAGGAPAGVEFELALSLRGSSALWFVPFSRETGLTLGSNWPSPSFSGAWLPSSRTVQADGFEAAWQVPFLGRDYPQVWPDGEDPHDRVVESRFGVELVSPVDPYRMAERSTKYASLFLVLTFGVLWLFDTLVGVRVHPIQLLLIGSAMCLFYLLELSLSEHVGFFGAYVAAAGGVVVLVGGYTKSVLRSVRRGSTAAGLLALLYAYLLTVLSLERYALLAGSLALFALLGVTMYFTRWVSWDDIVRADAATARWEPRAGSRAT